MKYYLKTDCGKMRESNQDNCYASSMDSDTVFAVVCDGMGGNKGGDVASEMAVREISERVTGGWHPGMTDMSAERLLLTAVNAANICVYDRAREDETLTGMGSTVVAAVIFDDIVVIGHAGDSRAYLSRDTLVRLTKDHSLVQELMDGGVISELEAENHPIKNYITRAIGVEPHISLDLAVTDVMPGDKILLCSDGLTNEVPESRIYEILSTLPTAQAVEKLIAEANDAGGEDNITAVVVEI